MNPGTLVKLFPDGLRGKRIHVVGAGGSGVSSVLLLAREQGAVVTGCDVAETTMTRLLEQQGIPIQHGHNVAHVDGVDLVVTNPAVTYLHPDHAELQAAEAQGIPVTQWQPLLGYLMRETPSVAIAGVHGKGSTGALVGTLAIAAGLDPTVELGAVVPDWKGNVRMGHGKLFINEADEWNYNFLNYHPRMVVLTAVEYDHPEFFESYEVIRDAFVRFLQGMDMADRADVPFPPTVIYNDDIPGCRDVISRIADLPITFRPFSMERADAQAGAADVRADTETSFTLLLRGKPHGRVTLATPGTHNIANAVAAAAAADALGIAPEVIVRALSDFGGLRRRFEIIEDGDVTFVDDYAHHPHAVALTIATARQRFPGRRLIAAFQPTLFTRLHRFLQPFAAAFDEADEAIVVEIQPSRERDTGLIHGNDLVKAIAARPVWQGRAASIHYGGAFDETAALLRELRQPGDVYVIMGSGPVNRVIAPARLHG
ncbi:MAG TPA: UDP-N-acetylmuramate--L-alanine ligase [Ktedonobacterales bacterium]|nr:UDP-N-acetylmuramate--L-alanine ligase [Ktedonobacterales bacterium]